MPKKSGTVSAGQQATALQYNDARDDALNQFAEAGAELTIATGVVTIASTYSTFYDIDTQGDAGSDDLVTINGGEDGEIIIIRAENAARTVVVKHDTGNIVLQGAVDHALCNTIQMLMLRYDGSDWIEIASGADRLVVFGYNLGGGAIEIASGELGDVPYLPALYLLGMYAVAKESGSVTISVRKYSGFGIPVTEVESFVMTSVQTKSDVVLSGVTREQNAGSWRFYADGASTTITQVAIVCLGVRL
jgi:hypothetical protein